MFGGEVGHVYLSNSSLYLPVVSVDAILTWLYNKFILIIYHGHLFMYKFTIHCILSANTNATSFNLICEIYTQFCFYCVLLIQARSHPRNNKENNTNFRIKTQRTWIYFDSILKMCLQTIIVDLAGWSYHCIMC